MPTFRICCLQSYLVHGKAYRSVNLASLLSHAYPPKNENYAKKSELCEPAGQEERSTAVYRLGYNLLAVISPILFDLSPA
jgi:hypothetical protein